ncbi:MAG: AI-2E family transporter [Deltaproteobacteria bacterium]|nr:AI-2E family transporter [Deltaproteobacteria bacterium]
MTEPQPTSSGPPGRDPGQRRVQKVVLVALALGLTALFLAMIRQFLMALLLAAIAAGMFRPLHLRLVARLGGRPALAAAATVLAALLLVVAPATLFLAIVGAEAVEVSQIAGPWVQDHLGSRDELDRIFEQYPTLGRLAPYREQLLEKLGGVAGSLGELVVAAVTSAARETATFLFLVFVMLYSMFFFLIDGEKALRRILFYLPLEPEDEARLVDRFLSVSRATIRGTLVIGLLQGALGGLGLWVAGVDGAALWAAILAVLSAVPGVGPALVWAPAAGYFAVVGDLGTCFGLVGWFAGVVGTVDNFLRPRLIGKDTKMPDLLILLGTLGGIVMFGPAGFLVGPIVTALFLTVWELYGETFRDVLPGSES